VFPIARCVNYIGYKTDEVFGNPEALLQMNKESEKM